MNWRLTYLSIFLLIPNSLYAVNYGKAMQHYNNNHDVMGEMIDFAFITLGLVVIVGGAMWFVRWKNDKNIPPSGGGTYYDDEDEEK